MPRQRWTSLVLADFRGARWLDAYLDTENPKRLRVQMHPSDDRQLLLRLGAGPSPREGDELEVMLDRVSRATLAVCHVQQLPSWKGDVRTVVVTFDSREK